MKKEKIINKSLNIIYYSLNIITLPLLYIFLFIYFKIYEYNFYSDDPLNNIFFFTILTPLTLITWRIQWLISEYFESDTKFGLDFYKFGKRLNKLKSLKPIFNEKNKDNKLDELFEKYCLDETIRKIHVSDYPKQFRGGDLKNFTRIDKNLFNGLCSYIVDGVKIELKEQPPLYLIKINNRFDLYVCKHFEKKLEEEIKTRLLKYPEHDLIKYNEGSYYENNIKIYEYAIIMGTLIKYISKDKYDDLLKLHKDSEKIYDEYMLEKRLKE